MPWPLDRLAAPTGLPLEGVKVLDLSRVLAGPFATQLLGDLGADVIKVEQRGSGDPIRQLGPPFVGETASYYLATNRNRRSVVANLDQAEDFGIVAELAASADIIVENFLPHQAKELGIDGLRASLPEAVWISVRPASSKGPLGGLPAFDLLAQARSGIMGVTGEDGGEPLRVGTPISDVLTGLYAATAALAGLHRRTLEGRGTQVEVPLLESMVTGLVNQAQGFLVTGVNPVAMGNHHPSITPYGPVDCADGLLMLAVGTESQYRSLVRLLDDPRLTNNPRFVDFATRSKHREELLMILAEHFTMKSRVEWIDLLGMAKIPAAPINSVEQALTDPQILAAELLLDAHYDGAPVRLVGSPLLVDGLNLPLRRDPPILGADDLDIRSEMNS